MLWVLDRTVSLRWLFLAPKSHVATDGKDINFMFIFCCCLSWPKSISVLKSKLIIWNVILLNCKSGLLLFLLLLMLLPFWSVLCFVVCNFVSILVLQSYLVALLCLSCWCIIVVWLFLTMRSVCLQFKIVVFPDHTHFLFLVKQQTGYHILIACSLCIKYIIYSRLNLGV